MPSDHKTIDAPAPIPAPAPDILTPAEAAHHLRISLTQLYRLASAGVIPRIKIGRSVRFRRHALDAWLERKEH